MVPELVRTWVAGWAVSRGTPSPVERPWGLYLEVGHPAQVARHVLPDADGFAVRAAADSVSVPHTWLKVPMEPEDVGHWLTEGWAVDKDETGYLMAVDLRSTDPVVPEGYSVSVETHDGVVHVRVHDAAGDAAARGQMVVVGRAAVVDKVGTDDTHRRRGLGAFVMRAFADHAVARGAVLGVLGATPEGRSLYENLGWKVHAPLAACIYKP